MGQILHGCTTTTAAVRRAIQNCQGSLRAFAEPYDINPKTIAKWKTRGPVHDLPTEPKEPLSSVLMVGQEGAVVTFRRHTLLVLYDYLYARRLKTLNGLTFYEYICKTCTTEPN